ncbi:MAG: DHH family phosphoesterase [Ruminiclostridium sp.]|nr:DHH family phosphoesterase [Ruminiclostridium sp.]
MQQQTFHQTISRLTGLGFRVFFGTCLLFAVLTGLFNVWLSVAEVAVVLALYLYLNSGMGRRKKSLLAYLDQVSTHVDAASRRAMVNSPLPVVIFRPDTDDIVWCNDRFLHLVGSQDGLFEAKLSELIPSLQTQWIAEGHHICDRTVEVADRQYLVYGSLVSVGDDPQGDTLATTYWVDVTEYADIADRYESSRPILMIIQVDNYEDLTKGLDEGERSSVRTQINNLLTDWLSFTGGMLCRYDRDHFLFLMEAKPLQDPRFKKFSLLEDFRAVQSPNGVTATLSIGVGRNAETPNQLFEYASLALDMALSRGGDQVVIKNGTDFSFIGGRAKETERRTKVKSRVVATAFAEILDVTEQVIVMGHKAPDLDVMGAVAGVVAMARKKNVPVHIVQAPHPYPAEAMALRLAATPEYKNLFIQPEQARHMAGPNTTVVVVDTNRPEQTQAPELLTSGAKIVVIDHHRRAVSYIENPSLSFQDPYASSASELVTELVQYNLDPSDLKKVEAEALLSGIVLDTKAFTMRTGSRTFEVAAFLRKTGADTTDVKKFFQNNLADTITKFHIIQQAEVYRKTMAITWTNRKVGRAIAGQAADELLNISGIDASFVLFPEDDQTYLSSRSSGKTNVQVISEMLGGGGNAATAGAQFPGISVEEALPLVKGAIDRYFEDET